MENDAVFEATHRLALELVNRGGVDGAAHRPPDGLYDPKAYFGAAALLPRDGSGDGGRAAYVVVEKIVAPFEDLPEDWAVHGTTGYRFANVVNGLFVDGASEARLDAHLRRSSWATRRRSARSRAVPSTRSCAPRSRASSRCSPAGSRASRAPIATRATSRSTPCARALGEVLAAFPVYRTYIDDQVHPDDRRYIEWAVTRARAPQPGGGRGVFDFVRDALDLRARLAHARARRGGAPFRAQVPAAVRARRWPRAWRTPPSTATTASCR